MAGQKSKELKTDESVDPVDEKPGPEGVATGDPDTWKLVCKKSETYAMDLQGLGAVLRVGSGMVFIPGARVTAGINNGHKLVRA